MTASLLKWKERVNILVDLDTRYVGNSSEILQCMHIYCRRHTTESEPLPDKKARRRTLCSEKAERRGDQTRIATVIAPFSPIAL